MSVMRLVDRDWEDRLRSEKELGILTTHSFNKYLLSLRYVLHVDVTRLETRVPALAMLRVSWGRWEISKNAAKTTWRGWGQNKAGQRSDTGGGPAV